MKTCIEDVLADYMVFFGWPRQGDYIFIPAHTYHRITWTRPKQQTVWLAIHLDATDACWR